MFSLKRQIGNLVEGIACKYLKRKGFTLIEQNYLTKMGELDLIMWDNSTLVFVEVRYKKHTYTVSALASINRSKQQKLMRTALFYLQQYRKYSESIYRFDVVGVSGELKYPDIKHIENAIIY